MSKPDYGLGGAPDIKTFIKRRIDGLKKSSRTFRSLFDFVFSPEENVMAEYTDGNRIFTLTYGQCRQRTCELSDVIAEKLAEIPEKAVVGLYMDNRPEWIELFWALLRNGYIPLLMNKRLAKTTLENVLAENAVGAVITDSDSFSVPTYNYEAICGASPHKGLCKENWADEIIFMSSGTSANVKLCLYSGEKICRQIYNTEKVVLQSKEIRAHVDGRLKQLAFLPFYHVFGFLACYMWFAFFGRTFVFLNSQSGDAILKTVRKHKVTHIFAVPLLWTKIEAEAKKAIEKRGEKTVKKFEKALVLSEKLQNAGLGTGFARLAFREIRENIFGDSIRFMITGGGAVPNHTLRFFNGIGYRLVNGYGMTEIGISSVELSSKPRIINSGSVGQPFDSMEYKSVGGELAVRGGSMASCVVSCGKRQSLDEKEWFITEDLAAEDKYGWRLEGRKDDLVINASGENISPALIEKSLCVPGAEFALLGLPAADGTVRSVLLASLDGSRSPETVRSDIASALKKGDMYRQVDEIKLTKEPLIKGSEFKLNRRRIKEDILSGSIDFINEKTPIGGRSSPDGLKSQIAALFEKALGKAVPEEQYGANFFYDLDGSSLCYFGLVEEIKSRFGVDLLASGAVYYSVNDVYAFIKEKLPEITEEETNNEKLS